MKFVAALCAVTLSAVAAYAKPPSSFTGVVTYVSDGDTLWVRPTRGSFESGAVGGAMGGDDAVKVRFQGIDAPEICQAGGAASQAALKVRVLHQTVTVQSSRYDDYGRILARISLGAGASEGTGKAVDASTDDVAAWMVSQGHAWSYRYRNNPGPYAAEEQVARGAQRGVWAMQGAIEPRLFRKQHGPCH